MYKVTSSNLLTTPIGNIEKSTAFAFSLLALGVIAYIVMHFSDCGNIGTLNVPVKDLSFLVLLPGAILALKKFRSLKTEDKLFVGGLSLVALSIFATSLTYFYADLGNIIISSSFQMPYSVLFLSGVLVGGFLAHLGDKKRYKKLLTQLHAIKPQSTSEILKVSISSPIVPKSASTDSYAVSKAPPSKQSLVKLVCAIVAIIASVVATFWTLFAFDLGTFSIGPVLVPYSLGFLIGTFPGICFIIKDLKNDEKRRKEEEKQYLMHIKNANRSNRIDVKVVGSMATAASSTLK